MRSLLIPALALAAAACARGDGAEADQAADSVPSASAGTDTGFAYELDVDTTAMTRSATGLYLRDVREGQGEPIAVGQTAMVHYTGWLPDGSKFDSSLDRDEPLDVALGQKEVIPGWEEGLLGMKVGGRRKLVIPPQLAYKEAGIPGVIPPSATLVFEVELVEIR